VAYGLQFRICFLSILVIFCPFLPDFCSVEFWQWILLGIVLCCWCCDRRLDSVWQMLSSPAAVGTPLQTMWSVCAQDGSPLPLVCTLYFVLYFVHFRVLQFHVSQFHVLLFSALQFWCSVVFMSVKFTAPARRSAGLLSGKSIAWSVFCTRDSNYRVFFRTQGFLLGSIKPGFWGVKTWGMSKLVGWGWRFYFKLR